jgi:hypothetical protein
LQKDDTADSSSSGNINSRIPKVMAYASLIHTQGTGGAALLQRSSLNISQSNMSNNRAAWGAGGLLMQQQWQLSMTNSNLENNSVSWGSGGGLAVRGPTGSGSVMNSKFVTNAATAGSGGAMAIDSGLGPLEVNCEGCEFAGNSAGQVSCYIKAMLNPYATALGLPAAAAYVLSLCGVIPLHTSCCAGSWWITTLWHSSYEHGPLQRVTTTTLLCYELCLCRMVVRSKAAAKQRSAAPTAPPPATQHAKMAVGLPAAAAARQSLTQARAGTTAQQQLGAQLPAAAVVNSLIHRALTAATEQQQEGQ